VLIGRVDAGTAIVPTFRVLDPTDIPALAYAPAAHAGAAATASHSGLGTAAAQDVGAFATAAQGTDSRVPTAAGMASVTHAAEAKTPLADNDELAIADSAATYGFKKVLWSVIKGTFSLLAHGHTGTVDGAKLTQAATHESPDTDSATTALHHTLGTGANQALPGNTSIPTVGAIGALATVQRTLFFDFDGGGAAITTAAKALIPYLPMNFTPTRWTVQCSVNARAGAAGNASVAFEITVGSFSTSAFPSGATGGTQPSVTAAAGATAAANFTDTVWDAGQAVMVAVTGTPTALWATLVIEGTSVA
jgi:hypothetical protein